MNDEAQAALRRESDERRHDLREVHDGRRNGYGTRWSGNGASERAVHQCPHPRCDGRISLHRRGAGPGQPHQADHARRLALRRRRRRDGMRRDGHRRHGRDADARHDRRASASLLEQRARHRPHPDDGARGAHARHHGDGEARARRRLHRRAAAPRPPSRGSTWSPSSFINEGRFPGPRYLAAGPEITTVGGLGDSAPSHIPHRGPEPRHRRLGAGGGAPHRAHADQIRRRFHQAQPLRRGDHRHGRRGNADVGGGGGDGGAGGALPQQGARPPMPARPARSSSASATASRTSTTPPSPTRRRSTCWRRPRTGISWRRASPG